MFTTIKTWWIWMMYSFNTWKYMFILDNLDIKKCHFLQFKSSKNSKQVTLNHHHIFYHLILIHKILLIYLLFFQFSLKRRGKKPPLSTKEKMNFKPLMHLTNPTKPPLSTKKRKNWTLNVLCIYLILHFHCSP